MHGSSRVRHKSVTRGLPSEAGFQGSCAGRPAGEGDLGQGAWAWPGKVQARIKFRLISAPRV